MMSSSAKFALLLKDRSQKIHLLTPVTAKGPASLCTIIV